MLAAHAGSQAVNKIIDLLLVEVHFYVHFILCTFFSLLLMDMARSRVCSRQDRFESVESCLRYFHFLVADFLPEAAKNMMNNAKHMYMHLGCCSVHENRLKKNVFSASFHSILLYIFTSLSMNSLMAQGEEGKIVNCKTGSRIGFAVLYTFFFLQFHNLYLILMSPESGERTARRGEKSNSTETARIEQRKCASLIMCIFILYSKMQLNDLARFFCCFCALFIVPIGFRRTTATRNKIIIII